FQVRQEVIMDRFMEKCAVDRKIVELLILKRSSNSIAKQEKVGKKRVGQIKEQAVSLGYLSGTPLPPYPQALFDYSEERYDGPVSEADQALLEHKEWVKDRIEAGWHLITIWEELPFEVATEVSRSSFFRFIKRHNLNSKGNITKRVIPEILDAPGESLQLDWGKLCDVIDPVTKKKKTLWFLVGVMGFSRYMMTRLVWGNSTDETLKAISSMLSEMGGTPLKITSDNPKCFATEASKFEAILNPAFERFCGHYGIIAELLPPRDPQKKGKVEKAVPYVRRLYEAHGEWDSIEEAQRYIDRKMVVANERKHGTTRLRPIEVFLENEIIALSALPPLEYSVEEYHSGKVRKDGCVRFRNKYYSVGEERIGDQVFVIGSSKIVEIFFKGKLLETHTRISSSHQAKSIKKIPSETA
ncbi:MAG: transposase, partial [Bacteriovoracaceae bacterium]|nr:transposase [Bacteriovoracaceae bacterium]